jgi:predicted small lipoprotein YifL
MIHPAPRLPAALAAAFALGLALAASGCGLKGALTMPSQSEEIVIRPAAGATTEGTAPADPTGVSPAPQPGEKSESRKVTPREERLPPPPLPGGNSGTVRSG